MSGCVSETKIDSDTPYSVLYPAQRFKVVPRSTEKPSQETPYQIFRRLAVAVLSEDPLAMDIAEIECRKNRRCKIRVEIV